MNGIIYVLANASHPDLLKIGGSGRCAADRARELSVGTGVPSPFVVVHEVRVDDWKQAEVAVHDLLQHHRPSPTREFFRLSVADAIRAVDKVAARFSPSASSKHDLPLGARVDLVGPMEWLDGPRVDAYFRELASESGIDGHSADDSYGPWGERSTRSRAHLSFTMRRRHL